MRTFLLGTVTAVGLALGFGSDKASAEWVYRTAYRWDPVCGHSVAYRQKVWVPDRWDHHHRHHGGWHRGPYRGYPGPRYDRYRAPSYLDSFFPYRR